MIEVYLFYAAFLAQVVLFSFYYPRKLLAKLSSLTKRHPQETHPPPYPQLVLAFWERRSAFKSLSVLGLICGSLLLVDSFIKMRSNTWDIDQTNVRMGFFLLLQFAPLYVLTRAGMLHYKNLKEVSHNAVRNADTRPRRLFDFVSPAVVGLAVLLYILLCVIALYVGQDPTSNIEDIFRKVWMPTFANMLFATGVFYILYGRKRDPYQDNKDRLLSMEIGIKALVIFSIADSVYFSIRLLLPFLDLQNFTPLAHSLFDILILFYLFHLLNNSIDKTDWDSPERKKDDGNTPKNASNIGLSSTI